jgi:hypothetical protein
LSQFPQAGLGKTLKRHHMSAICHAMRAVTRNLQ